MSRFAWLSVLCLVMLFHPAARADEQAEAVKIVDQAIKAVGGEGKAASKMLLMKGKGVLKEGNNEIPITGELTTQGAENYRLTLEVSVQGMTMPVLLVITGKEGWAKVRERVEPAPKDNLPSILQAFYAARSVQMLTALKDQGVKLSPLGEANVDGKPALGIKVVRPERSEMDIYFDKTTHLPVKCATRFKGPRDQEGNAEYFFSDYKEFAGLKHFGKMVLKFDGMDLLEIEVAEVKLLEKVDEGTFAKPE